MKCTLTQLNAFKNLNSKKSQTIKTLKLPVIIVMSICFLMCFNLAQAQTNDCPEGDPLALDWMQELTTNYNCEDVQIIIKFINQFEYNGNDYFVAYQGPCNDYTADADSYTYFDCQGNVVCSLWAFNTDCDQEILDAARNSTTIWRYEYNCTDPFELYKVLFAIEDDCTDAIYAFDYEGEPYLYFKKGCNYFDEIYNCKTQYTCSKGWRNYYGECDTLLDPVQNLLIEDNAIWANPCTYEITGTVEHTDDCGYLIHIEDDISPLETSNTDEFTFRDGQTIEFSYNISQADPFCFVVADITCIRRVAENCGCNSFSIHPVCGVDGNTYNNYCLATCQGVEVAYHGECIPCYDEDPLQAGWVKELIANDEGCTVHEIQQFEYNGEKYFAVLPYTGGAGFDRNGQPCLIDVGTTYYDCLGNIVCYYDGMYNTCDAELFDAANSATTVWTYNEAACSNPLDTDFVQQWINDGCAAESIYSFEYEGETFIYAEPNATCDIFYQGYYYSGYDDEWNTLYNCNTGIACYPFLSKDDICYDLGDSFYEDNINENNLVWTKPCTYELTGEVVQYEDVDYLLGYGYVNGNCGGLVILMETEPYYLGDVFNYLLYPEIMPEGFVLQEGQIVELTYRSLNTSSPCNTNVENVEIICIREANQGNQMKCPENNITSICAPVAIPPSLSLQDFSTTDDPNYMNSISMQMEEQTEWDKYFNTTTRVYTISDESGNQKTCETKHHIANQFLQMPEVTQPDVVCEEDLWSHIKIGIDQYKIYSDQNGSKGAIMSTCNTPSLICSTANLGVDTSLPNTYNFWASTYFEFPDGSTCESEAMPFYVDVQAKPVATLSASNKTMQVGEGMPLMDLVTNNQSGYWSGDNIVYLMTATGENIAYFSSNTAGVNKLYYTVRNDFCERSYLLMLEVMSSGKAALSDLSYKTKKTSFNMYPNPTKKVVFIDLPEEVFYQISLTNISGKVVKQLKTELHITSVELNVNDLPKGIYLVELKNASTQLLQKLVIE